MSERGHDQDVCFMPNYYEGLNLNPCLRRDYTALKLEPKGFIWLFSKLPVNFTEVDFRIMRQSLSSFPDSMSLHSSQPSRKTIINSGTRFIVFKAKRDY